MLLFIRAMSTYADKEKDDVSSGKASSPYRPRSMAPWEGSASVEVASIASSCAKNHLTTAIWTARRITLTDGGMIVLQVGDVCGPLFFPEGPLPFQNATR